MTNRKLRGEFAMPWLAADPVIVLPAHREALEAPPWPGPSVGPTQESLSPDSVAHEPKMSPSIPLGCTSMPVESRWGAVGPIADRVYQKADAGEGRLSGGAPSIKGAAPRDHTFVMDFPFCYVFASQSAIWSNDAHDRVPEHKEISPHLTRPRPTPPGTPPWARRGYRTPRAVRGRASARL